jgi:hypothetical protein
VSGLDVFHLALHEAGLENDGTRTHEVVAELRGSTEVAAAIATECPVDVSRDLVAWMEGPVKWIVSSKGTVEAYDLETDPSELHNLAMDGQQIEQAQARAARWWSAHPPVVTLRHRPQRLDPETRERMRRLGY